MYSRHDAGRQATLTVDAPAPARAPSKPVAGRGTRFEEEPIRRALDLLIAGLGALGLGLIWPCLAVLIKLDSPGPIVYRRRVLARGGGEFDAFKFRTMVTRAERVLAGDEHLRRQFDAVYKLEDDPRVTRLGRWLRKSSLDELPQLLNVLKGDMSVVGPRMIHRDEAPRFGDFLAERLTVKPGLTGLWQILGRSQTSYAERVELDRLYMSRRSLMYDLRILARTIPAVLSGRGAH
ncbi:MAG: sugar transferase [Chloroflexi bacterium]|nr:sugar transferase [Chloroflexota bacterium]